MIAAVLALAGLTGVASAPARLFLANEALTQGGVFDSSLSRQDALGLLRRLNRIPPLAPPQATILLLAGEALDAQTEQLVAEAATSFDVDSGFALVDSFGGD
mmetsp:Transcript_8163/g.30681  ORF Transcript_8163/g.30681 Transcript_8163/m.30681 type:complete len:102 (-) Transcript_8163:498-803(-)